MRKLISIIIFFLIFLPLSYSYSLKQEFNKINYKLEEENVYSPFDANLSTDNNINLIITSNNNILKVEEKGMIYFITNYNDNERNIFNSSDIEEKTKFKTKIKDEYQNEYDVHCNLWKPINDYIRIICNLDENLKYVDNNITLLNSVQIEYKDYKIGINQEAYIEVKQLNYSIPFLYSNK